MQKETAITTDNRDGPTC